MEPAKDFRIQNKWVYLTYPRCYFEKNDYRTWLKEKSKAKILKIKIAQETHEDGEPHMHVLITYEKTFQTRNCRYYDYEGHHPHVGDKNGKNPKNAHEYAKCVKYICKQDKDLEVTKEVAEAVEVWNCDSLSEAMLVASPMNARLLWDARPSKLEWKPINLPDHAWYAGLEYWLTDAEVNWYRKIIWVKDSVGNTGKTVWGLKMYQEKKAWYINSVGNVRDMAQNIKMACENGWTGEMLIVDLPRDAKDYKSIYAALEMLKGGLVTTTKYTGGNIQIPFGAKIVVLANFWPRTESCSHDRWLLLEIENPDMLKLQTVANVVAEMREEYERNYEGPRSTTCDKFRDMEILDDQW